MDYSSRHQPHEDGGYARDPVPCTDMQKLTRHACHVGMHRSICILETAGRRHSCSTEPHLSSEALVCHEASHGLGICGRTSQCIAVLRHQHCLGLHSRHEALERGAEALHRQYLGQLAQPQQRDVGQLGKARGEGPVAEVLRDRLQHLLANRASHIKGWQKWEGRDSGLEHEDIGSA